MQTFCLTSICVILNCNFFVLLRRCIHDYKNLWSKCQWLSWEGLTWTINNKPVLFLCLFYLVIANYNNSLYYCKIILISWKLCSNSDRRVTIIFLSSDFGHRLICLVCWVASMLYCLFNPLDVEYFLPNSCRREINF